MKKIITQEHIITTIKLIKNYTHTHTYTYNSKQFIKKKTTY